MTPRRVDRNQATLVQEARALGLSVLHLHTVGDGCPDLLIGGIHRGTGQPANVLVEVKDGRGKLRPIQVEFAASWRGEPPIVARSLADVLRAFGWGAAEVEMACPSEQGRAT